MKQIRKAIQALDRLVEWIGAYLMVVMVAIVVWQVFARYVLHHTPAWSEEIVLLLMMWFGFLSIVIGFRHRLHLRISLLVDRFPKPVQKVIDKFADILIVGFGFMFVIEGYKFVVLTWASTLPVTKLPQGIQYLVIPIAGMLTILYGLIWLFGWKEEHE